MSIKTTLTYLKETKRTVVYEDNTGAVDRLPPVQQIYINKAALASLTGAGLGGPWPMTVTLEITR